MINPLANASALAPPPINLQLREEKEQNLRRDQVIRASVAEGGIERVLLEAGSRQFWVETNQPLKTGQKLNLQVVNGPDGVELRPVLPTLGDRLIQSLHLLGEKFDLLPLVEHLLHAETRLRLAPDTRTILEALQLLLTNNHQRDAGILLKHLGRILGSELEAGLHIGRETDAATSLKGVLLQLLDEAPQTATQIRQQADQLLRMIEAFQLCRIKLYEDGSWLVPLPLPFLETGFLVAERHQQEEDDNTSLEQSYRITLHLKPQNLGCMKVDLLWQGKALYLRIECAESDTRQAIEAQQQELVDALQPLPVKKLSFGSGSDEPAGTLAKMVIRGRSSALNARI